MSIDTIITVPLTNPIVERALDWMAANDHNQARDVLGFRRADGTECFCAIGSFAKAAHEAGYTDLDWQPLGSCALPPELERILHKQGAIEIAYFDRIYYKQIPPTVHEAIGIDEGDLIVPATPGSPSDPYVALAALNDTGSSLSSLAALIRNKGLFTS